MITVHPSHEQTELKLLLTSGILTEAFREKKNTLQLEGDLDKVSIESGSPGADGRSGGAITPSFGQHFSLRELVTGLQKDCSCFITTQLSPDDATLLPVSCRSPRPNHSHPNFKCFKKMF